MAPTSFDAWLQAVTFVTIALAAVFASGIVRRLLILVGLIVASLIYAVLTNGLGWGKPIDFTLIENAAWLGAPHFTVPVFEGRAIALIVPVAAMMYFFIERPVNRWARGSR